MCDCLLMLYDFELSNSEIRYLSAAAAAYLVTKSNVYSTENIRVFDNRVKERSQVK